MSDEHVLAEKIDALQRGFNAHVLENVSAHNRLFDEIKRHGEEERRISRIVFGNGQIGVTEKLRSLERFVDAQRRLFWLLVPAVVIGACALVWQIALEYLRRVE